MHSKSVRSFFAALLITLSAAIALPAATLPTILSDLLFSEIENLMAGPQATITVQPITWNVIGLDSNDVNSGPNTFPVGARVCSSASTTNVSVNLVWDSANPYVNLRSGSLSTINIPSITGGACSDAYFEVAVTRNAAAYDTTRRFHITATDSSGTASTTTPRELYVEHLISQNRNAITGVKFGPDALNLTTVPAGGSMNLVVGNTYTIQLLGGTATQGYNQFESFINFPNTIFQVLGVSTTYSADDSPYVPNPSSKLYADACGWQNDPNAPTYRSCVGGDFKAGGSNVVTNYTVKIIGGGGTAQPLGTLLYDFSGSSYHYNSDFGTGARIANVIDPTASTISTSFSPNPASLNGLSVLTLTVANPNAGTVSGYNFVDNLPANLVVASTPGATTSGCGTPTVSATAGSSTITFSNGTVAANSTCVIKVNVTPTATGSLVNTTNNLFIGSVDTGHNATATLTVNNEPPPGSGLCGVTLAAWRFPSGFSVTSPAVSTSSLTTSATAGVGLNPTSATNSTIGPVDSTLSWASNGSLTPGTTLVTANDEYFQFGIDTTGATSITLNFNALEKTANGPTGLALYHSTSAKTAGTSEAGAADFSNASAITAQNAWQAFGPFTINSGLNPSGLTYFRVYSFNSGNTNSGSDINIDNVVFTGCAAPVKATIGMAFSPSSIAVNGVSTLTFTLTNTNTAALTGAAFTDSFPADVQVAATPAASTTCAGATWAPTAGATSLTFTGGTIPASGSCTVSVNVTATSAGPHSNVSGTLSTTEGGTNTTNVASATLTGALPPSIAQIISPSPILAGGVSTLSFTISNPNQNDALSGVAFADSFPTSPGAMTVAAVPNATTTGCGSPSFAPVAGSGSLSFSGGTVAAGGTCTVTVRVTAPVMGTYNNTTGNVSYVINSQTVNGNTASASLAVSAPHPSIHLLKEVATSASGPWRPYLAIATGGSIFYRFTIENTGDVALVSPQITDSDSDVSTCNAVWSGSGIPVAVAANDNHISRCTIGPIPAVSGLHTNTATVTATYGGNPVTSPSSSATYATTGLTLANAVTESSFNSAGDVLHYSYLVTNSGFATLAGPVTISDDKATVACPYVSTVGDLDNFLDPGESVTCTATYTATGGDVTSGQITNNSTASADGVNSNSSSTTVALSTSANVSVTKTLSTAGPFIAGQSISYSLVVANAGPSTATNIQVSDTPTNMSITNVSGGGCAAMPCTIASLASGANATITVTATINAAGAFDNSATAMGAEVDPSPANNTDNTGNGGTATASSDVSMTKTLQTAGPYSAGQSVSYLLLIANSGPSPATNVQVSDTPTNMSITNVSGSGCSSLPCTIASISSGANTSINVTATINSAGAFDNSATATASESDPNNGNNTDSTGNGGTAAASSDVSMTKTLTTVGPFVAGQSVSYSLVVANSGPSTATNVQVTDTPTNMTITNVSGSGCAAFPCTIASIASGANATINVTATITADGPFDNSATASGTESDPNSGNNTDSTGNGGTAAPSADVSMSKALNTGGPYVAGQSISYSLVVGNAGPSTATNIQVTDTPTNLTITNVSGSGCSSLPCTIASLASGANTTINVTATINAGGSFDNSATATATESDPSSGNNTDSTGNGGTAAASSDVSLVKTLTTAGPYSAGQSVSYSLVVANAGPSTATNIQVTDTPTNLSITNVSGGGCSSLPCTISSLAPSANTTVTVTATIGSAGSFDNTATATATEADPNGGNNTDSTGNGGTAAASSDISMTKTLTTGGPYLPGQAVSYSLVVANAGPSSATNVQVTDTPTNMTITNVSGSGCSALPCTIASVAPGATTTVNVTATLSAPGAFDNSATATAAESDPNGGNNTDSTGNGGTAAASSDISLTKTLITGGPYFPGQSVSYSLVVSNAGPSTATSVQLTDTPTNMTITNVSGGGGCTALPCTIGSIASGASATVNVTATLNAPGAFDNSATTTAAESDPNGGNNTDSTGNGGTANASSDISMSKTLTTAGPYFAGQSLSYVLLIANSGPSPATNIQVTDMPTNLTITNVSGGGCSAMPCTITSLASGANAAINLTATVNAAGPFDNSAAATAAESDPNRGNNSDSTGNGGTAAPSSNISMVKTPTTSGPYFAGQLVTYSLVIANTGPSPATNIQVTDTPTNMTITNVSGSGCSSLPCTISSLSTGANKSINVTARISAAGTFDNTATATAAENDPDGNNNTDSTGNGSTAAASSDVSMVKTLVTAGAFTVGQSVTYTLAVSNAGPSPATNIQISDAPTNMTVTNVSGGGCSAVPCTIPSLAAGATTVVTVTATINAAGAFDNSANASAGESDPDPSNNSDSTGNGGTAGKATPSIATVASANTTFGNAITDTATVSGRVNPQQGGSVTFNLFGPDNATCSGSPVFTSTVPLSAATAQVTSEAFTPTQAGTYRWVASYSGDANNHAASGACNDANETVTVGQAATSVSVVSSLNPSTYADNVTFTATVSSGPGVPTGTVIFSIDGVERARANVSNSGVASMNTSLLTVNGSPHVVTAQYSGDGNFRGASATLVGGQVVNKINTTTLVITMPDPSLVGQAYRAAIQVLPASTAGGAVTGAVTIRDTSGASCSTTLPMTYCDLPGTSTGPIALTATYSGNDNYSGSTGRTVHVVNPVPTPTPTPTPTPSPTPIDCIREDGGCEGDINRMDPFVQGRGDNRLDGDDLIWYDIFANGFICAQTSPNEFQRMDVAPSETWGDGALGLDRNELENILATGIRVQATGPLTPVTSHCSGARSGEAELKSAPADPSAIRALRIGSVVGSAKSAVEVPIEADLGGGEAMVQFTVHFDPSRLLISDAADFARNLDVIRGADLPEGTRVVLNTTHIADGDIGVVIYFNGPGHYPAVTADPGIRTLVTMRFRMANETRRGSTTPITFNDEVFITKVSDSLGQSLPLNGGLRGGAVTALGSE